METIILYKQTQTEAHRMDELGEGYRLEPYQSGSTHYKGEDDGGREYLLPDDGATYTVADDNMGCPQLWRDGEHCAIVTHPSGWPQLVFGENQMPVLKLAGGIAHIRSMH